VADDELLETDATGDLLSSPHFWIVCFVALHLLILTHAGQWYAYNVLAGNRIRPFLYLRWAAEVWYSRAALAPLALWFARRYPFSMKRWALSLTSYAIASIGIALLGSAVQSAVVRGLETQRQSFRVLNYFDGRAPSLTPLTPMEKRVVEGWPHFVYNMFTCWMVMGLVQGIYFYRDAEKRKLHASRLQTQLARVRLEALRMQLNPHFLFNTLHAISTLIHDEPDTAEEMLLRLGELLRLLLQEEQEVEVPLSKELSLMECQLGIEAVRFRDRLTTSIRVEAGLLDCAVPQLILQPLVENAIRHGIGRRVGSDSIKVVASSRAGQLWLEVSNSSSQLDASEEESFKRGIGLSNTRMRLHEMYREDQSISLKNLSPSGVCVSISLPLRKLTTPNQER
jgi:two-component system, LytTR family, sensor kinase